MRWSAIRGASARLIQGCVLVALGPMRGAVDAAHATVPQAIGEPHVTAPGKVEEAVTARAAPLTLNAPGGGDHAAGDARPAGAAIGEISAGDAPQRPIQPKYLAQIGAWPVALNSLFVQFHVVLFGRHRRNGSRFIEIWTSVLHSQRQPQLANFWGVWRVMGVYAGQMHPRADDATLVQRTHSGDEGAFEAIFKRHHAPLLSYCRHMLGPGTKREDALQQAFIKAHQALLGGTAPRELRPWLYAIARNCCLTAIAARRPTCELQDHTPTLEGLSEEVHQREDLRELVAGIGRLPEDQRSALLLAELDDLPPPGNRHDRGVRGEQGQGADLPGAQRLDRRPRRAEHVLSGHSRTARGRPRRRTAAGPAAPASKAVRRLPRLPARGRRATPIARGRAAGAAKRGTRGRDPRPWCSTCGRSGEHRRSERWRGGRGSDGRRYRRRGDRRDRDSDEHRRRRRERGGDRRYGYRRDRQWWGDHKARRRWRGRCSGECRCGDGSQPGGTRQSTQGHSLTARLRRCNRDGGGSRPLTSPTPARPRRWPRDRRARSRQPTAPAQPASQAPNQPCNCRASAARARSSRLPQRSRRARPHRVARRSAARGSPW